MKTPIEPKKNVLKDAIYSQLVDKPIGLEDRFYDPDEEFLPLMKWESDHRGFVSMREFRVKRYGKRRPEWD